MKAAPHQDETFERGTLRFGERITHRAARGTTSGDVWLWESNVSEWLMLWPPLARYFVPDTEQITLERLAATATHECPHCHFHNTPYGLEVNRGKCVGCMKVMPLN